MTTPQTLHAHGATLHAHPQGAHVTGWIPADEHESRLFLSGKADFAPGVAIRGGVPVIFPQFASEGPLPKHGFARTRRWQPQAARADSLVWQLADDPATRALWPQAFCAELHAQLGVQTLRITLAVHNSGTTPLRFTAALHSYLAVQDIADVELFGLADNRYRDSTDGGAWYQRPDAALRFAGEVDRIYCATRDTLHLRDGARALRIVQGGFTDTVVWNPGAEKAAALADLEPNGWQRFVCVEAAVVEHPVTLAPGERWQGWQALAVA